MNPIKFRAVKFFRDHAGYVVGQRLLGALKLANAEREAMARGWYVEWEDETYAPDFDDPEIVQQINEGVMPWQCAILYDAKGELLDSLGGIAGADHDYRRVVVAELALSALSEIDHALEVYARIYADANGSD